MNPKARYSRRFNPCWILSPLLMVSLLLSSAGCSGTATPREIRIGVIVPLSTDLAYVGTSTVEALKLAVQEVNTAGGLQVGDKQYLIALLIEDNQDSAEAATAAALKLINQEDVVALIGPQASRNAIPVSRVAEDAGIPMISPWSTNPETTRGKDYVFRAAFIDDFQGQVMARFVIEEFSAHDVAVLYDAASDYNRGIAEIFKQVFEDAGGDVVAFESYATGEEDFREALRRVQESGAEVLFLPNYPHEVYMQVGQAQEVGLDIPIIGSDSWGGMTEEESALLEGAYFSTHWYPENDSDRAQDFVEAYRDACGKTPDDIAALTYDAIKMLFAAIQAQGSYDPEAIRTGLANITRYEGVTGQMEYRGSGDPVKSAVVLRIVDGQPTFYKLVNP